MALESRHVNPRAVLRFGGPFLVSGLVLGYLFSALDARRVFGALDAARALALAPAVLGFALGTLALEALSLARVVRAAGGALGLALAARLKAASYPLALIHYGLGAAGLALLVQRRSGLGLEAAGGAVLVIALVDLALVVVLAALGAGLAASPTPALRAALLVGAAVLVAAGFAFLRAPISLGPLERLRNLALFAAARGLPLRALLELGLLRLAFVSAFAAVTGAALAAFGVAVPLPEVVVGAFFVALVAALPVAVAGLGTGQLAFVELFQGFAAAETLLACHLTLSLLLIAVRGGAGLLLAGEFSREALAGASKRPGVRSEPKTSVG
jgi:hypothetical protein